MLFLYLLACDLLVPVAEVYDACEPGSPDTGSCVPCEADAECVLGGNPCYDTVACMHEDANLAFADLGCSAALEHDWPDAEGCRCVEARCAWSP
jgi:hypothetical protein